MQWEELKARLLEAGSARLSGEPAEDYIAKSTAGPGAGEKARFFLPWAATGSSLRSTHSSPVEIAHRGGGVADLYFEDRQIPGRLLRQGASLSRTRLFITVTEGCIFSCRYCSVPRLAGETQDRRGDHGSRRIGPAPCQRHIAYERRAGEASGRKKSYVCEVIGHLKFFGLPIGVSIYPTDQTPDEPPCPRGGGGQIQYRGGHPGNSLQRCARVLTTTACGGFSTGPWNSSVRARVFSNVIVGLGETDAEMEACVERLTSHGVIPVLRPLNPVAGCPGRPRPSAGGYRKLFAIHRQALARPGLDTAGALTMCTTCAGCNLVPGRDE